MLTIEKQMFIQKIMLTQRRIAADHSLPTPVVNERILIVPGNENTRDIF